MEIEKISESKMSRHKQVEPDSNFAAVFSRLMKERGVRISEVANATGISLSTMQDWPFGVNPTYRKYVKRVADYFQVSTEYMYEGNKQDEDRAKEIEVLRNDLERANRDAEIWKVQMTFLEDVIQVQKEEIKQLKAM